jgi:hypothetical protein
MEGRHYNSDFVIVGGSEHRAGQTQNPKRGKCVMQIDACLFLQMVENDDYVRYEIFQMGPGKVIDWEFDVAIVPALALPDVDS